MSPLMRLGATLLGSSHSLDVRYERGETPDGGSQARLEFTISGTLGDDLAGQTLMDFAVHEGNLESDDPDDDDGERAEAA